MTKFFVYYTLDGTRWLKAEGSKGGLFEGNSQGNEPKINKIQVMFCALKAGGSKSDFFEEILPPESQRQNQDRDSFKIYLLLKINS